MNEPKLLFFECSTLKMMALRSYKTSKTIYPTILSDFTAYLNRQTCWCCNKVVYPVR